jgi:hypothetical protein
VLRPEWLEPELLRRKSERDDESRRYERLLRHTHIFVDPAGGPPTSGRAQGVQRLGRILSGASSRGQEGGVKEESSQQMRGALARAEWERLWEEHFVKPGLADPEQEFLAEARLPEVEKARLERITAEFETAFERLHDLGPAVTVFGSARFSEGTPEYELGVELGRELARAGFAVVTGGGPGLMEAANRGAAEAGGVSIGLNIILPHEQGANPYVQDVISFRYFFTRRSRL